MIRRYQSAVLATLTAAAAIALSVPPAGANTAPAKVPVPTFQIASLGSPDPAIEALMPVGPQHVSMAMTLGGIRNTESGYVDFTGGTESACSFNITAAQSTGGKAPTEAITMTRDPGGLAYAKQTVGIAGEDAPKAAQGRFIPIGGPWAYIFTPVSWTPASLYGLDDAALGPKQAGSLCRFTDLPYYTTLQPGTTTLTLNISRLETLLTATEKYYSALFINALDLATRADAEAKLKYLDRLASPTFMTMYNSVTWTLTKRDNVVTLKDYGSTQTAKKSLISTLVFTPTARQKVPAVSGPTPGALKIASLCGPANAWKNLQKLAVPNCTKEK